MFCVATETAESVFFIFTSFDTIYEQSKCN